MAYDNSNSGSLRPNDDKKKPGANPKWPDYKGKATIEGDDYWISGWKKDGGKWLSLVFTKKDKPKPAKQPDPAPGPTPGPGFLDEDVPF